MSFPNGCEKGILKFRLTLWNLARVFYGYGDVY